MSDEPSTNGSSTAHWGSHDPASEPSGDQVAGLSRLVLETRSRLGPEAPVQKVLVELRERGLEVTEDDVRACWDRGC